jgi:DNA-binding beta-propeller fold protein YncE
MAGVLAGMVILGSGALGLAHQAAPTAPRFEVDPMWPRPLPNHWLLGSAVGVAVDSRDHVYVLHLTDTFNARTEIGAATNPPTGECCIPAPSVLEFDQTGALVGSWGGPSSAYTWPSRPTGIGIDPSGNVWIGGSGGTDSHVLKFTRDGRFIMEVGRAVKADAAAAAPVDTAYAGVARGARGGARGSGGDSAGRGGARGAGGRGRGAASAPSLPPDSHSREAFGGPADFAFDARANEVYIADGYRNHRVAVIDMNSGAFKRYWGAYGNQPDDNPLPPYDPKDPPAPQFRTVRCVETSQDGLVYVCDGQSNRIQVFRTDGSFVKEKTVMPATRGEGAVWDIALFRGQRQPYIYVADGANMQVHILDRVTLDVLTSFGDGGRQPGQFYGVHSLATDSRGNLYTVETYQGKRVQKFNFRGVGTVTGRPRVPWPGGRR